MSKNFGNHGQINLNLGCMWSGKTTFLLTRFERHSIRGKKCLLVRYKRDNRYHNTQVVTHNKRFKINAHLCTYLYELDDITHEYDVICVDEIQFFNDAHIF